MGRRERERRRPTPVLSSEQHRTESKLGDKPVQIVCTSGDIVGLRPRIRVPESAQVHGDDGVALGQPRHDISPRITGVREPVQQNDRRPGTADHVVHSHVIHQPPFTGETRRQRRRHSRRRRETGRAGHVRGRQLVAHRSPAAGPHGCGGIDDELADSSPELLGMRLGLVFIESILGRPDLVPQHSRVIVRIKAHLEAHHPVLLARRVDQPVESLAHLPVGTGPRGQLHNEQHLRGSWFGHGGPFPRSVTLRYTLRM
jgi:hypothetical protein